MTWWRRLFNRTALESQLDRELQFHVDERARELVASGVEPLEARRRARLDIGGPEQVKESCRDARGTRWVDDLLQDIRYALRSLRHRLGFTAVTVATLALGIGATTVMFTLINSVLLKPFAYPEPDRLVSLIEQTDWSKNFGNLCAFAYPNYQDCARNTPSLTVAAWRFSGGTVTGRGNPEYVNGLQVSPQFLGMLGVGIDRGRSFLDSDDQPGAARVAIVSDTFSQHYYGSGAAAIGAPLVFDATPYTVIGVTGMTDRLPSNPDVVTLVTSSPDPRQLLRNRNAHPGIQVWGRLRPGATIEQAQSELTLVGRRLAEHYTDSNRGRTFVAEPLRPDVGDVGATLWLLLAAVGLVLLVACANIGS